MTSRLFVALIAVAAPLLVWVQPGAAQNQDKFKIRLTTVPMDGGMRDAVAGSGSATAVLSGAKLTVTGSFTGLRSAATAARVHRGAAMGVRGSPIGDLTVTGGVTGTISGSIDLTPDQVQGLRKGQLYLQIASEKAPDGNLWGWLLRS
jgi:hypothetical protein